MFALTYIKIIKIFYLFLVLLFFLSPLFEIKIIITLVLLIFLLKKTHFFYKKNVFTFLFAIFSFAFIFSPYWHFPVTYYFPKYIFLLFLIFAGIVWAYVAAGNLRFPKFKLEIFPSATLCLLLYLLNYKFLSADIAYRGDEDYHINRILNLFNYFHFLWKQSSIYVFNNLLFWLLCLFPLFLVPLIIFFGRLRKVITRNIFSYVAITILPVLLFAVILFPENIFRDNKNTEIYTLLTNVFRYPFLQVWLHSVFTFPNPYVDIIFFRAVPFLSLLLLANYFYYVFNRKLKNNILSLIFSLAFATIPTIIFYSNILYLEMPVLLFLVICVFNIKSIIKMDYDNLKSNPLWYCLLLLGFLKETVLIFYLLIIILRVSYRAYKRYPFSSFFVSEIKISLLVLTPILLFLSLREGPQYEIYLPNILNGKNLFVLGRSLQEQTGGIFALSALGLFYIARKKETLTVIATLLIFSGTAFFLLVYVLSTEILAGSANAFIGYSRLNLFLIPIFFYLSHIFLVSIKRHFQVILLLLIMLLNIIYFPFTFNGIRKSNWGSPFADAAEYIYPYNESIRWLSKHYNDSHYLIVVGQYYPYSGLRYYFNKYKFYPKVREHLFAQVRFDKKSEESMLYFFLGNLVKNTLDKQCVFADVVLYHSVNNIDLKMNNNYGGYTHVKKIQNSESSIYIFHRI